MTTKTVTLSETDAAQIKAILMTHAEMQDRRTLEGERIIARLTIDQPDDAEAHEMIAELQGMSDDLIDDTENLKRIAELF